jgi:hypothetical protein
MATIVILRMSDALGMRRDGAGVEPAVQPNEWDGRGPQLAFSEW